MDIYLERALIVHAVMAVLAFWPAVRLLRRTGLPVGWAGALALPMVGWPILATLLAFRKWPALPPKPERLHPRERLRRERERAAGRSEV